MKHEKLIVSIAIAAVIGLGVLGVYVLGGSPQDEPPENGVASLPEGLGVEDINVGTGRAAARGDRVRVHYRGTLLDGTVFDSSRERGEPFSFVLGEGRVIQGWELGLLNMHEGGTRKLTIPPALGYGAEGHGVIPPNATLSFEIELLSAVSP